MTVPGLSEMFAYHATTMANTINTSLVVFSRKVGVLLFISVGPKSECGPHMALLLKLILTL